MNFINENANLVDSLSRRPDCCPECPEPCDD